jgi:DNA mismatch repair protein MutS2
LDLSIVEVAKEAISPEELRAESLLDEIHRQKDATRDALREAKEANEESQSLRNELNVRLSAIDEERRKILNDARLEGQNRIDEIQGEISKLSRKLAVAAQPLEIMEQITEDAGSLEADFVEPVSIIEPDGRMLPSELRLGDHVHIGTINAKGVVTELGSEYAQVQVGRLRIRAKLEELTRPVTGIQESAESAREAESTGRMIESESRVPPLELDIRGQRIDEALDVLEKRLDAAFLAGMPFIRVIHGKGTGKLRGAIREALKDNAYVSSFEPGHQNEGGDGVTRVVLASS